MGTKKLSAAMFNALTAILAHEDAGSLGAPAWIIPARTRSALHARDLIEPTVDGGRRLTARGRVAVRRAPSVTYELGVCGRAWPCVCCA